MFRRIFKIFFHLIIATTGFFLFAGSFYIYAQSGGVSEFGPDGQLPRYTEIFSRLFFGDLTHTAEDVYNQTQGDGTDNVVPLHGKVGIGTTSPDAKLTINADTPTGLYITTPDQGSRAFRLRNKSSSYRGLEMFQYNNGTSVIWNNYSAGGAISISPGGSVGISRELTVYGTINARDKLCIRGNCRTSWPSAGNNLSCIWHRTEYPEDTNDGNIYNVYCPSNYPFLRGMKYKQIKSRHPEYYNPYYYCCKIR